MRRWLLALFSFLVVIPKLQSEEPNRWNVLMVTADDLNADSAGWMGNSLKATPNIDAFAATAHRFVNHHVTVPICQPSRSALMTGLVPHRNGALGFHPIRSGTPTLVTIMKSAGWLTAVIDKHPHMKPDTEFPWDLKWSGSGKNPQLFGEHVTECIRAAEKAGKPFFLNANITDPHRPFVQSDPNPRQGTNPSNRPKKDRQRTEAKVTSFRPEEVTVPSFLENLPEVRREIAQYYSSVRRFDQSFGELMRALKNSGQEEKTMILFLSDHGMSFPFSKATVYRNGTWSPLLLRWPGMENGQERKEFISSIDIVPTLLDLLKLPPIEDVDGRSCLPLLHGESQIDRDFVVTHVNTVSSGKSFPQRCVRTKDFAYQFHAWPDGTPQFKVEAMSGITFRTMAEAADKDPILRARVDQLLQGTREQFFDLRSDPDERTNQMENASYQPEIKRLRSLLLVHMEKTKDPQLDAFRRILSKE